MVVKHQLIVINWQTHRTLVGVNALWCIERYSRERVVSHKDAYHLVYCLLLHRKCFPLLAYQTRYIIYFQVYRKNKGINISYSDTFL